MRALLIALAAGLTITALSLGIASELFIAPAHGAVGAVPADFPAEVVSLQSADADTVAGWLARGTPGLGAVLLLHGVRDDRRVMLDRARFLHHRGYSVLLIDLPAHGESSGSHITYGKDEATGVRSALAFLAREFPREKIGVIGVSLGAASLVLSRPDPAPSAVVLESMFPTIREAVADRLHLYLGPAGGWLLPVVLQQMFTRHGSSPDDLQPVRDIGRLACPVFIAAGDADRNTTLAETMRVYEAAREPKELWIVKGAGHVDLHAFDRDTYEQRVAAFLDKYLRGSH